MTDVEPELSPDAAAAARRRLVEQLRNADGLDLSDLDDDLADDP